MDTLKKNIPVLISVLALILSAGSLYVTSLKGANITLSVGDRFGLKHKDHYLYIFLPMVVHNTGAQAGLIHSFGVILKDQKSEEAIFLKWQAFANLEYQPDGFHWIDESNATAVSVPARSDIAKMATFSGGGGSVTEWIPKPTTYDMHLVAWTSDNKMPSIISPKSTWTFNENDVLEIKQNYKNNIGENKWITRSAFGPDSKMLSISEFDDLVK